MNSVERIIGYSNLKKEQEYTQSEINSFDKNWPTKGEISFKNVDLGIIIYFFNYFIFIFYFYFCF